MAQFYPALTPDLRQFIAKQHVFFTATAPRNGGRVNLSPKGMDTFRVLSDSEVAYLDLTGSGNETAAHLRENRRITLMFCAFQDKPLIVRLYCRGRAVRPRDAAWGGLIAHFHPIPGQRQIIAAQIESVQTSCGFAVPLYVFEGQRDVLTKWAQEKGEAGIRDYWRKKNLTSIDGLPTELLGE